MKFTYDNSYQTSIKGKNVRHLFVGFKWWTYLSGTRVVATNYWKYLTNTKLNENLPKHIEIVCKSEETSRFFNKRSCVYKSFSNYEC